MVSVWLCTSAFVYNLLMWVGWFWDEDDIAFLGAFCLQGQCLLIEMRYLCFCYLFFEHWEKNVLVITEGLLETASLHEARVRFVYTPPSPISNLWNNTRYVVVFLKLYLHIIVIWFFASLVLLVMSIMPTKSFNFV